MGILIATYPSIEQGMVVHKQCTVILSTWTINTIQLLPPYFQDSSETYIKKTFYWQRHSYIHRKCYDREKEKLLNHTTDQSGKTQEISGPWGKKNNTPQTKSFGCNET